jgi:alpha-amylase/alpha-mannosidase (GH57 family)
MTPAPVRLVLVWHMHQPYYLDPDTGESVLPWVRLHALKDYWGMVALLDDFPRLRVTVNLVPSLVEQVQAYAEERTWDRTLVLGLKPAEALDRAEGEWLVREGFHAHAPTMIDPYPRYAELLRRRIDGRAFDAAALRDLQIWQKLAWVDPDVAATDPRVKRLHAKARGFDEDDKAVLRAVELDVLRRVVPAYAHAAARGQVELATSPYYHPILPLLCDSAAHHDAHPGAPLPEPPFRWPEDAAAQLARAVAAHTECFGERPRGVWPSEGSVSPDAAAAIALAGFAWLATDEDILRRSRAIAGLETPPALRYRPHEFATAAGPVRLLFRDHALSDAVGFVYQRWAAAAAADDFLARVRAAARSVPAAHQPGTVTVILDGENAWEHYAGGGRPFLRALYQRIAAAADIAAVTASEAAAGAAEPLPRLFAGSWIHSDFGVWIGHADDRRAWSQLAVARRRFDERRAELDDASAREALDALHAAEGSDWFWWYGDDHSSAHDRDFDALFRRHLRRAWRAMGEEPPAALFDTNITTAVAGDEVLTLTVGHDGPGASYFDRLGLRPLERPGGTMHREATAIRRCEIGLSTAGLMAVVEAADGIRAALEVTGSPTVEVAVDSAGLAVVGWPDLGVGGVARVRVVARDAEGRVVETVPADGLGRRVAIPRLDEPTAWTA